MKGMNKREARLLRCISAAMVMILLMAGTVFASTSGSGAELRTGFGTYTGVVDTVVTIPACTPVIGGHAGQTIPAHDYTFGTKYKVTYNLSNGEISDVMCLGSEEYYSEQSWAGDLARLKDFKVLSQTLSISADRYSITLNEVLDVFVDYFQWSGGPSIEDRYTLTTHPVTFTPNTTFALKNGLAQNGK